ncbi:AmmeMemoRadiSam system protein B, partial [bacterium]|nr:AmmeMemoRadiSam system protein B [bacterium]
MRRRCGTATARLLAVAVCLAWASAAWPAPVRRPVVAGSFYPDDPARLRGAVEAFLASARPAGQQPLALIAPHAGYIYSGQIAADAWNQVRGHAYDLIVILGTNHTTPGFTGVSVYAGSGYRTPLGTAAVDVETSRELMSLDDDYGFTPAVHAREHSIEVQVPFAQVLFPDTPLLAAIVGLHDPESCEAFGHALADLLRDREVLIVASSDLSHYPHRDDAEEVDRRTLEAMGSGVRSFFDRLRRLEREGPPGLATCACGEAP